MTHARELSEPEPSDVKPTRQWTQRQDSARALRADATRLALIAAATELFTTRGYHDVSVRDFAAHAGVTRGALYHHFQDKEAVFLAVFDSVEREMVTSEAALRKITPKNSWTVFRKRIQVYLDAVVARPAVQRITLVDGPAVLGWARWRQLEETYGLGTIVDAVQTAIAAGVIRRGPVEPLAHLILGSVMEAALLIANDRNPKKRRSEVGQALDDLLGGLAA